MNTSSKRIGGILALALLGTIASGVNAANEQASPCPGYGMGPGMMHGWGTGPRSMWGGGDDGYMGRGMMGQGMMYGQGPGMMNGNGPGSGLNLDESQQKKMTQIQDELRKKHWELMGKMNDENARLRDLYQADKRDPDAIGKQLQRIFDLRRQMMVDSVEAQNRMEEMLTDEQKKQMRNFSRPGGMMW
jgi:Spy/CpxP family protein refolding chaperone